MLFVGLVIIGYLNAEVDLELRVWQFVFSTSHVFLPTDMIFDCLTSELQIGRVATAQSETLGNFAKILVSTTGPQHHSVVLGS